MFKKGEDVKSIEELTKSEFVKLDIEFSRTEYGKKIYRLALLPAIMTAFSTAYVFTEGLANGYIDITNISILLMVGLGLTAIAKIMYYQSLSRFYSNISKKK